MKSGTARTARVLFVAHIGRQDGVEILFIEPQPHEMVDVMDDLLERIVPVFRFDARIDEQREIPQRLARIKAAHIDRHADFYRLRAPGRFLFLKKIEG